MLQIFVASLSSEYKPYFEVTLALTFGFILTVLLLVPALVSNAADNAVMAAIAWLTVDAGRFTFDTENVYAERMLALQYFGMCERAYVVAGMRVSLPLVYTIFWTIITVALSLVGVSI